MLSGMKIVIKFFPFPSLLVINNLFYGRVYCGKSAAAIQTKGVGCNIIILTGAGTLISNSSLLSQCCHKAENSDLQGYLCDAKWQKFIQILK
jgi:hypothetical protein